MQLASIGDAGQKLVFVEVFFVCDLAVHGSVLMRILTVAQGVNAFESIGDERRHVAFFVVSFDDFFGFPVDGKPEGLKERSIGSVEVGFADLVQFVADIVQIELIGKPAGDGQIVGCGMCESACCQFAALFQRETFTLGGFNNRSVGIGRGHDCNRRMVLRCCTHHGRATDINLLDAFVEATTTGNRLSERVEVANNQVKCLHTEFIDLLAVVSLALISKNARVDHRVQGLHATFEDLRETGDIVNGGNRDASFCDLRGGRAGGNNFNASASKCGGKLNQTGLVIDGNKSAGNGADVNSFEIVQANGHGFLQ